MRHSNSASFREQVGFLRVEDIEAVLGAPARDSRSGPLLWAVDAGFPAAPGEYQLNWVGSGHLALAVVSGDGKVDLFCHFPYHPEPWFRQTARQLGVRLPF
jgi:hypothetical protein